MREKKLGKRILSAVLSTVFLVSTVSTASILVNAATTSSQETISVLDYSMEGYATTQDVTGGGVIEESDTNYYKVSTAEEFLKALTTIKKAKTASVIDVTADLALGSKEIGTALTTYKSVVEAATNQPLLHPTLLETGVSMISIKEMSDLTIFSSNGSKITHACFNISKSSNIIVRNLVFDEIWEWDENTSGDYDRNDWDYFTIQNSSTGVWIDHCTFYKAYDGIIDVKKASATQTTDVTISYSQFLPGSEGSFFDDMMSVLEENPTKYTYYNSLLTTYQMTKAQVRSYASAQKKTHLIGASDSEANTDNLRITLANNYYKNSMDRMPRLRAGYAHVYNCIMDASDLYELRNSLTNSKAKSKVVSNGSLSTCGGSVLLQNTSIDGIINAMLSGNGSSTAGFIGAMDCSYTLNEKEASLSVTDKTGEGLVMDTEEFLSELPYEEVTLYDASTLEKTVLPYTGAGEVALSTQEWMQTSYETDATIDSSEDVTVDDVVTDDATTADEDTKVSEDAANEEAADEDTSEEEVKVYSHNFTETQLVNSYFSITGSLSASKGTVSYNGLTLTTALKMESSTKVSFTVNTDTTLTLVANSDCSKSVLINGEKYSFKNGMLEVSLTKGNFTITKGDSNVNLYYMSVEE